MLLNTDNRTDGCLVDGNDFIYNGEQLIGRFFEHLGSDCLVIHE